VLSAGEPLVIGGPMKCLKTTLLVDLGVSLATAGRFLNDEGFRVGRPYRVGLFSGESGRPTLQETLRRVLHAKGTPADPTGLDGLLWGFTLPRLSSDEHLQKLARVVRREGLEVVALDPLYLCLLAGSDVDPRNLFAMGAHLRRVTEVCLGAGATPILSHHFRRTRNGQDPYSPPELDDLVYAGVAENARQWLLLSRRERYQPGSGVHRLWLTVGGSAGQSGEWAVDVEEGGLEDPGGRRWAVSVGPASAPLAAAESARARRQAERELQQQVKLGEDAETALARLDERVKALGRPLSKSEWRDSLVGWNSNRFNPVLAVLLEHGFVEEVPFEKATAGRGKRTFDGYRPAPAPATAGHPDDSRTLAGLSGLDTDGRTPGLGEHPRVRVSERVLGF
jgi:hypothetical protein